MLGLALSWFGEMVEGKERVCPVDKRVKVSYSLTELAKTPLYKNRKEISPHDIPRLFQSSQTLMELVNNCMYGCLGFSNSRFYAKPLAALITLQGREILQQTIDLVQNNLNFEGLDMVQRDLSLLSKETRDFCLEQILSEFVIGEVNTKYKCLEIDLDGLYKRMSLVKKKKYAVVKEQLKDGKIYKGVLDENLVGPYAKPKGKVKKDFLYMGLHLRFEIDMVAHSLCDFDGDEEEKKEMQAYCEIHFLGQVELNTSKCDYFVTFHIGSIIMFDFP
nr:DNA polymerase alpha catalytic subunit [Tanacetum cinerariifolium]